MEIAINETAAGTQEKPLSWMRGFLYGTFIEVILVALSEIQWVPADVHLWASLLVLFVGAITTIFLVALMILKLAEWALGYYDPSWRFYFGLTNGGFIVFIAYATVILSNTR